MQSDWMGFQLGKEISIFEEMNDWCDFVPKAHVIECDTQDSSRGFVGCERESEAAAEFTAPQQKKWNFAWVVSLQFEWNVMRFSRNFLTLSSLFAVIQIYYMKICVFIDMKNEKLRFLFVKVIMQSESQSCHCHKWVAVRNIYLMLDIIYSLESCLCSAVIKEKCRGFSPRCFMWI